MIKKLTFLILIICFTTAFAQNSAKTTTIDDIVSNPVKSGDAAGISVTVLQGEKIIYNKSFGLADIEDTIQLKNTAQFQIGSITKVFTASAIYKLREKGLIDLNNHLSDYLPGIVFREHDPTIRQLLEHTSGISEYTMHIDYSKSDDLKNSILRTIQNTPLYFEPGTSMSYSNSGYYLLGLVIEEISGMRFSHFVNNELIDPYGFKNISYYQSDDNEKRAYGYAHTDNGLKRMENPNPQWPFSAGNISSNALDLAKWFHLLNNGKILEQSTFEEMKKVATLECGHKTWYGSGLFIFKDIYGRQVVRHSGAIDGFLSDLCYYPEYDLTIAVLVNTTPKTRPENISIAIANEFTGLGMSELPVSKNNDDEILGDYGGYFGRTEQLIKVIKENDTLKISDGEGPPKPLFHIGKDQFTTGLTKYGDAPLYKFVLSDSIKELHYTEIGTHGILTNDINPDLRYWSVGHTTTSKIEVDGKEVRVRTKTPYPRKFSNHPTVVLENGNKESLDYWGIFFEQIGDEFPIVAYDRAGLGGSEWVDSIPTDSFKVKRLKKILSTIGAKPPYVLVGHSYGSDLVRRFAEMYPNLAQGLVLLDPVSENPNEILAAFKTIGENRQQYDDLVSLIFKDSQNPWSIAHTKLEKPLWDKAQPYDRAKPTDLPITVLFAGQKPTRSIAEQLPFDIYAHQKEMNMLILNRISQWLYQVPEGEMIIIPSSGHMVFRDEPELCLDAVKNVVYPDIHRALLYELDKNGKESAIKSYFERKGYYPVELFNEQLLNILGYRLLRNERYEEAIAIFELNTIEYPNEPNPYDSLGDGYRQAGNLRKAVESYEKAALIAEKKNDPRANNYRKRFEHYKNKL